ncbi:hypothetical protein EOPP23_17605 [Endozoicomonas sp. OPT23]|uniref:hypothetical protein n=1 Tax=Endozoicomonas sp. OPT23 TaxID=2072845 RepID=UPI00129B2901|nr:hypothetical protein [Endozoicomonas sp. OPT23]MRI34800.1 hypothetical protein [Endozoicomonas sp. OPT23]
MKRWFLILSLILLSGNLQAITQKDLKNLKGYGFSVLGSAYVPLYQASFRQKFGQLRFSYTEAGTKTNCLSSGASGLSRIAHLLGNVDLLETVFTAEEIAAAVLLLQLPDVTESVTIGNSLVAPLAVNITDGVLTLTGSGQLQAEGHAQVAVTLTLSRSEDSSFENSVQFVQVNINMSSNGIQLFSITFNIQSNGSEQLEIDTEHEERYGRDGSDKDGAGSGCSGCLPFACIAALMFRSARSH